MQANDDACGNGNANNYNSQRRPATTNEKNIDEQIRKAHKRIAALRAFLRQYEGLIEVKTN